MKAQQYVPLLFLREIKSFFSRIKDLGTLFKSGLFDEESCFPELPRKSKGKRALQLIWYLLRYGEILWQYNLYGLDVKPFKAIKGYIGNKELMWREYKYNVLMAEHDNTNILYDKRLFFLFLNANGFNTPTVFAYTDNGTVFPLGWLLSGECCNNAGISIDEFIQIKGRYFCKPSKGICGRGIFVFENTERIRINNVTYSETEAKEFLLSAFKDSYVIQDVLVQHPALSVLHASSVNTIRIITGKNKTNNQVEFVTGFLRIGGGDSVMDNIAGGGIAVGINFETGFLDHFGFMFNNNKSQRIKEHPVLHIPFDSIQIPHLHEAINSSIRLHERLDCLRFIGWDVAITPESISFIEGNDNPGLSQDCHGPKRAVIGNYI